MQNPKKPQTILIDKYRTIGTSVTFFFVGYWLRGAPLNPDLGMDRIQVAGAFLIFLGWLTCLWAFGAVICARLLPNVRSAFAPLALGSAFLTAMIFVLGHLGWIGYENLPLALGLLLMGPLVDCALMAKKKGFVFAPKARHRTRTRGWITFGLIVVFLGWLGRDFALYAHTDPLLYHLYGPRVWTDAGQVVYLPSVPLLFNCWYWEYLYVWGSLLLGGPQGAGLIEQHFFSQWTHLVVGAGGFALTLMALTRGLGASLIWSGLGALALFASKEMTDTALLAKNDWGAFFWVLAGFSFWLRKEAVPFRNYALGGGLIGLSIMSKPNVLPTVGALILVSIVHLHRKKASYKEIATAFGLVLIASLVTALPMAIRNWLATGSPIYPYGPGIFPSRGAGPTMLEYWNQTAVRWSPVPRRWIAECVLSLKDNPTNWALILAVPTAIGSLFSKKNILRELSIFLLAILAAASWFWMSIKPLGFLRWLGPPLLLIPTLSLIVAGQTLEARLRRLRMPREILSGLTLVGIMVLAFPAQPAEALLHWIPPPVRIREESFQPGGDAKAWLRLNVIPGAPVLSTGDDLHFYTSTLAISAAPTDPELDRRTRFIYYAPVMVNELRRTGARFIIDSRPWNGYFWSHVATVLHAEISMHPEAIAFAGTLSTIVDLDRIVNEDAQACMVPFGPEYTRGWGT